MIFYQPGYFLSHEDEAQLLRLVERGVEVVVQSVPGAERVDGAIRLRARAAS